MYGKLLELHILYIDSFCYICRLFILFSSINTEQKSSRVFGVGYNIFYNNAFVGCDVKHYFGRFICFEFMLLIKLC